MKDYIQQAYRTNTGIKSSIKVTDEPDTIQNLLHGAMGLCTESGELLDNLKKNLFYGKTLDVLNVKEELGDIFWYAALVAHAMNLSFEEIMEANISKLKARYPDKWNQDKAVNRNLDKEVQALQKPRQIKVLDHPHSWIRKGDIGTLVKQHGNTDTIEASFNVRDSKQKEITITVPLFSGQFEWIK